MPRGGTPSRLLDDLSERGSFHPFRKNSRCRSSEFSLSHAIEVGQVCRAPLRERPWGSEIVQLGVRPMLPWTGNFHTRTP
ncbi:hypothetical protein Nepgr_002046 [Nepenthes gracilis]|uniref:Uncharacterized protein n=1 Tax=Nepenthes gracilis TaxID=150966 RepID=A0AAD3P6E2_NEPGR|nr:hypothetical protein Nepgr_002046 [Nepenthes gracilis]